MKTVKKGTEYKRVSDTEAYHLVEFKGWNFAPKEEWKKNVRDEGKAAPVTAPGQAPDRNPTTDTPVPVKEKKPKKDKKDKK